VVVSGSFIYKIKDNGNSSQIVLSRKIGKVQAATPLIHPTTGNIYVATFAGLVYGLDPDDFSNLPGYPVDLGSRIYGTASLSETTSAQNDGNYIYVPTDQNGLHALNTSNGAAPERSGFPFIAPNNRFLVKGMAAVVDKNGNIYFSGSDKHVYGLRPDGTKFLDQPIKGKSSSMTIVDHGLIVPGWDGKLYRICDNVDPQKVCGFKIADLPSSP
jgi:outer membrane protein assembly factor BamB